MFLATDRHILRVLARTPWSVPIGLARSIVATATMLTLAANGAHDLFPMDPTLSGPSCSGLASSSLFCLAGPTAGRLIGIAALCVVVSGWQPRWTCVPHWYVSQSLVMTIGPLEGGDQVAAVLTLILLPNLLTDPRGNHWRVAAPSGGSARRYLAHSSVVVARAQVCVIYGHAAIGKLATDEWKDGTALYYWFTDPVFGVVDWAAPAVGQIVTTPAGVAALTWGTVLVELGLAVGIVAGRSWRRVLLSFGVLLHASIALLLGLVTFGLTMIGALVLYLVRDGELSALRRQSAPRPTGGQPPAHPTTMSSDHADVLS